LGNGSAGPASRVLLGVWVVGTLAVGCALVAADSIGSLVDLDSSSRSAARIADGARPGAEDAGERACGRLSDLIEVIIRDDQTIARCAYVLLAGESDHTIVCVEGEWYGPRGWNDWGAYGVSCTGEPSRFGRGIVQQSPGTQ
jgi:hypothetical protein